MNHQKIMLLSYSIQFFLVDHFLLINISFNLEILILHSQDAFVMPILIIRITILFVIINDLIILLINLELGIIQLRLYSII